MAEIMTTQELAAYLRLHEITVCKHAAEGNIPGIRVGRIWRFDKEEIDKWIEKGCPARRKRKTKSRGQSKAK